MKTILASLSILERIGGLRVAAGSRPTPDYLKNAGWVLLALAFPVLWWSAQPSLVGLADSHFLFWHTVVELFAVVVAVLIFGAGYRSFLSERKRALVLLGVAFLGVGVLDFLHLMSYVGMPDAVTANTPHKSMFFWLCARLLAAVGLLTYVALPRSHELQNNKLHILGAMLVLVGVVSYIGLRLSGKLPQLFVPGVGPTSVKLGAEWFLVGLNLATLGLLWLRRSALSGEDISACGFALALSGVSSLSFTLMGPDDTGWPSMLGHLYKTAAYVYLFHATINEALRRPMQRLNAQQLREAIALTAATDGILWVDGAGRILKANQAMEGLTGYAMAELVGQPLDLLVEKSDNPAPRYLTAPDQPPVGSRVPELTMRCQNGRMLPVEVSMGRWAGQDESQSILYIRDVSERKKLEASLERQAMHDELTGLPNRWLFRLQLDQALVRASRSGLKVAVLCLDLDFFKNVNDAFGHATGDVLLQQVGVRGRSVLREIDTLARLGGDEFAVLLVDLADAGEASVVASKLLLALQAPYRLKDQDVYSGSSLGLALYPDDAKDSDTLMRFADLALYRAKEVERGGFACFSPEMERRTNEDLQLYAKLKDALTHGGLALHYQPQIDVLSGAVVAAEALLRWHDAELGQVPPERFIPVAEATGLIFPVSDWVLRTACEQIAAWERAGTPLHVAVNFSAQQFRHLNLVSTVREALAGAGASAKWLGIEITESMAMTRPEQAREQLKALVELGCTVALDDFGTGYSSLAYLTALPISKLKVDKRFMAGVPSVADDCSVAKAVIGLAHSLGMTLVAEGVETPEQLAFLQTNGCEVYQGWLFAKAMTAPELTDLITPP